MGQWNTLHLFDDKKFYNEVVPIFKNDQAKLTSFFQSKYHSSTIEDPEVFVEERVKQIMKISNQLDSDFLVSDEYKKELKNYTKWQDRQNVRSKLSPDYEDFHELLLAVIFEKCASFFPYFRLGYRLPLSFFDFKYNDSKSEELMQILKYGKDVKGNVLGLQMDCGIRNWFTHEELKVFIDHIDEIVPKKGEKYAILYTAEFKYFLQTAYQNGYGLITCLDVDEYLLGTHSPIGNKIKWSKKENIISN